MNRLPNLNDMQFSTMTNALLTASDKFLENAQQFRELKPELERAEKDEPDTMRFIHSSACEPLAAQFDRQAQDAIALMNLLEEEAVDA